MTKGKALIECRKFLGPSGHVRMVGNNACVGTYQTDWRLIASGRTWGEAVEKEKLPKKAAA